MKFLGAQHGPSEVEFQQRIVESLSPLEGIHRCYLGRVKHRRFGRTHVFLGIACATESVEEIRERVAALFKEMFKRSESLDIIFLSDQSERALRSVQYPFFTRTRYPVPDFYLATLETRFLNTVRACFVERPLSDDVGVRFLLCEVEPHLPPLENVFGASRSSTRLVLASRHVGHSIFNVTEWPAGVHVCFLENEIEADAFYFGPPIPGPGGLAAFALIGWLGLPRNSREAV